MARTSKRHIVVEKQDKAKKTERVYIAGVYTRLSRDHKYDAKRDLSNSINGQIAIAEDYVEDNSDITITEIYTDYEYSGTNFERPAFKEMMDDIRSGKINCIIVKDLSRLGREYLEVGDYIETVFPFLGVRFISVNDKFDTAKEMSSGKPLEITLKNLINDMYTKDISKKIKSAKRIRMEQGLFVGSVPPYGYRVIKVEGGQKLELVSETAQIV
ncbi:MAG: recombinase family protein, partial [Tissierellia bacterium]|nr:recombinase family protein [Tissierellia bacterium]